MKSFMLKPDASNRMKGQGVNHLVIFGLLVLMLSMACPASTVNAADTRMKHTPPDYFVSEHRMQLDADVQDPGGINLVRCYFKAAGEADLVFVPMNPAGANKYAGILPAPSATTNQIEYLFLAVNAANQVVRTQSFFIDRNDAKEKPAWQDIPKDGEIRVSMELDTAPKELRGFSDNVTIDIVESGARFGVVALLYDASQSKGGGAGKGGEAATATSAEAGMTGTAAAATSAEAAGLTGAAAAATSAGTITAGTAGWGTATLVAVGVAGAAAAAGGTVAAVNALDDNDDDKKGGGSTPDPDAPTLNVSRRDIDACVVDANERQDDYYDMYLNGRFVGKVENPPGGTTCYNISLRSGNNILELRLTREMGISTELEVRLNGGEAVSTFYGSRNHTWNIVVP